MHYQPTNPYPYNTAIDLEEGLEFRFRADNYDIINSFEIELYDLLKNKKLYTINRCIGDIQNNKIVKGTKQLLQVFDENEEQVYLEEFLDSESSILPLKSKRNNLNLGVLNLSGYLATIEQIEKRKFYSEVDNAENLTLTKSEAFEIDENGVIVSYDSEVLSAEEKKKIVIPYELPFTNQNGTQKIKVTGINDNVFANNNELETIVIPSTVVFLGILKEPEGIEGQEKEITGIQIIGAFCNDTNLKKVVLNYGTSKIGTNCFWGCNNLAEFNFIDSIDEIGENAFRGCEKLSLVNCPTDLKKILAGTFRESGVNLVNLSKNLQRIDCYAFYKSKIVQLETFSELQFIGEKAFSDNIGLNEIKIAEGLKQCNKEAFANCSFTKVILPESLDSLGIKIFENCNKLEELTLPIVSINKIGDLFSETQSSVPSTLKKVNIIATENLPDYFFEGVGSLQEIVIADGLKKIGVGSFAGCKQLVKFNCPSTLEYISDSAFQAEVVQGISSNVTVSMANLFAIDFSKIQSSHSFSIGKNIFKNRNNMKEIILPNFISDIGVGVFFGCFKSSLGEVNLTLPLLKSKSTEEKTKGFKRYFVDEDKNYTVTFPKNLKKVVVSQVEEDQIEDKAFCFSEETVLSSIEKIELPDSVTKIGEKAFYNINFSIFSMPFNIIEIGKNAFNFSKDCDFYWTTLLTYEDEFIRNNNKESIFGNKITTCKGNKGVVVTTKDGQIIKSIYKIQGGTESEKYDLSTHKISYNNKVVADFSGALCFFGVENVSEVSGACGDYLDYTIQGNTLNITGYGDMWNFKETTAPWYGNRTTITKINLPDLTSIGDYAFYQLNLSSVNWEDLTQPLIIGAHSFEGTSLVTLKLPSIVTDIKERAFANNHSLTTVVIPSTVQSIGEQILYNSEKITSISTPILSNLNNLGDLWGSGWVSDIGNRKEICIPKGEGNGWIPDETMNENLASSTYKLTYNCYGVPCSLKEVEITSGVMKATFLTVMSPNWLCIDYGKISNGKIYLREGDSWEEQIGKVALQKKEFAGYLSRVKYNTIRIKKEVRLNKNSFGYCYLNNLIIEDLNSLNTMPSGEKNISTLFKNYFKDNNGTIISGDTDEQGPQYDYDFASLKHISFQQIKIGGEKTASDSICLLGCSFTLGEAGRQSENRWVNTLVYPKFANNGILDLNETNLTVQDIKYLYYKPINSDTVTYYEDYWIPYAFSTNEPVKKIGNQQGNWLKLSSHPIGEIKLPSTCKEIIPYLFDALSEVKQITGNIFKAVVPSYGLYGLTNLEKINFENIYTSQLNENAFTNCKKLNVDYYIDNTVTEIPKNIFKNCEKIKIHFFNFKQSKITKVGDYAFCGCSCFNGNDYYGNNLLVQNPNLVLGKWCFANSGLSVLNASEINFTNNIPEGAFWGCENLFDSSTKRIVLVEGVTSIGDYSLGDCNITDISFPTTMTYIGENSLYNYQGNSITLPFVCVDKSNYAQKGYSHTNVSVGACALIFGFLYTYDDEYHTVHSIPYHPTRLSSGNVDMVGPSTKATDAFVPELISSDRFHNLMTQRVTTPAVTVWSSSSSNTNWQYNFVWPDNLTTVYINNFDTQHQLHISDNDLNPYAFYGAKDIKHTYFKIKPTNIGTGAYTNAGTNAPELWSVSKQRQKKALKNISLLALSESNKSNVLYVNREKEYYWNLKLFGDKYDVYITDNNTFVDKNSYLPSVYAANHDGVEEKQHITIAGENTYEISNIEYFKSQGKTYYRQSKGIMSGPINYYGVANGMLTYNTTTSKYTVDEELRKVMSEEKVKFSMGSKYTSETYAGTICLKDGEIEVELQNDTTNSQFEFETAIALQYTIVTQASLSESLLNVVKAKGEETDGTKFTVASDNTIQEVTAINDYFNITFTPGFKNSVSGYTSVQMTLADKDEALILPNSLTTKQILIVMNTKGKMKIEGKKGEEIKRGIIEEDLLSLIIPQQTVIVLDESRYIVRTKNKQDNSITFSTEQNNGYIINSEQEKPKEIQLLENYMDIASTDFDKTNLTLTLNYINTYTVNKIEEYPYSVPTEKDENLYLITCEEVVNPTNFEVNERSLEKEAVLERQSMILTVKTTDGTALPHLLVEGDSYYEIYSNYIKSPSYYFRTLPKKSLNIFYNNTVVENLININSASATFTGYCENNISYYEWELYEYYIDDYILIDKFTNKYTTNLFYDCHKFVNNTNYKLKLIVTTIEGLKIEKEVYINVQYANDLILKNAFVEKDCLRQAIAIDLTDARFEYQGVTYPICPFSHEFEVGVYGKIKGFYVIRTIKDEPLSATIIGFVQGFTSRFYDYSFQREETYEYSIIPIFNPINIDGEVEQENLIRGIAYKIKPFIRFNTQTICLIGTKTAFAEDNEELQELSNCYLTDDSEFGRWYFKLNAEDKNVSITTDKNIYENNSPFASVNQTDRNYKTGSITVMLGNYHKTEDKQWTYKDSVRLQNKFQAFCNNGKVKMLRDEIGNVIPVDVTLKSFDYLPQAVPTIISVSFEWTQVASEENLGVYDYRKENELDKIYVVPFDTRKEVLTTPLKVQGLYFESNKKQVPLKEVVILSGQGVEYNESTGFISLDNKAPKTEIIVTVGIKNDESIKTTFVIPAID